MTPESTPSEIDRLRRQLRALSAVNYQLHEQLAAARLGRSGRTGGGDNADDSSALPSWVEELAAAGECDARMVRAGDASQYVVEGKRARRVSSGLLAAALAARLGVPRYVDNLAAAGLVPGPAVELHVVPPAAPFVVVGGRRLPVYGIPTAHRLAVEAAERFASGEPLDISEANVPRTSFDAARTGRYQIAQVRDAIGRRGLAGASGAAARLALRRTARKQPDSEA